MNPAEIRAHAESWLLMSTQADDPVARALQQCCGMVIGLVEEVERLRPPEPVRDPDDMSGLEYCQATWSVKTGCVLQKGHAGDHRLGVQR